MTEEAVDPTAYPLIDPTTFDLIVSGTGLPSSLLAAAAATVGKSVLHVDPEPFYGSHFSSLSPTSFSSFLLSNPSLYSNLSPLLPEPSKSMFLLDLPGPRLLYCADPMVDILLRSGASHHLEFKSIDGSLIYDGSEGRLVPMPDSREKIFKDNNLGPMDRNMMVRFLKLVQAHIANDDDQARVSYEDLEIPFVEFLEKQKLPPKISRIFLYGIALADYDQDDRGVCKKVITTKEGIESMALYIKSIRRFPNAVGAFIYPIYGQGELPQAFCRCAAVKGALYVLRMPVANLLVDEETKHCKGIRLASGQEIYCNQLVMEPSFTVAASVSPPSTSGVLHASSISEKVARGVCITNCSMQQDSSNILVIFPPRSLYPEQLTSVRALQLSSNVSVCPPGMFVVYFSTPCDDATQGKDCINAAMSAVFTLPNLDDSGESVTENEDSNKIKPTLLWSAVYVQEFKEASFDKFCSCPMPDVNLDYRHLLESTMKPLTLLCLLIYDNGNLKLSYQVKWIIEFESRCTLHLSRTCCTTENESSIASGFHKQNQDFGSWFIFANRPLILTLLSARAFRDSYELILPVKSTKIN